MEKKIKLFFPREMIYGNRKFEGGKVHEISEEVPGFINRWLKRGCVEVKEEVKEEVVKKVTKKKAKKKVARRKAVEKVEEKEENVEKIIASDES